MSTLTLKDRANKTITVMCEWTQPAKPEHWKEGRSAMELARAWFRSSVPACPLEIQELLDTNPRTAGTVFTEGFPEYVTSLPQRGEGRNHDLMLCGHTAAAEKITVCVEAKADERFGDYNIGEYWHKASVSTKPTNAPKRIKALLEIVFGPTTAPNASPWSDLRYQLLTALAGTAIQAANDEVPLAVLIIHEFQTHLTTSVALKINDDDFKRFVEAFCSVPLGSVKSGKLYGPVPLPAGGHLKRDVDVFIGKVIYK